MQGLKQKLLSTIVILALLGAGVYIGTQIIAVYDRSYQTEIAVLYDMSDTITCEGFLSFDEVEVDGQGMLGYLVENGERVSANTNVAEIYTDASQAKARQNLTRLEQSLQLLTTSENTVGIDLDLLLTQRQQALYNLLDTMDAQAYTKTTDEANQYILTVNRLKITTGEVQNFASEKAVLEEEKAVLLSQLGAPQNVAAPEGGYFVRSTNSSKLNIDRNELNAMDANSLQQAIESDQSVSEISGAGKIIKSYKWFFYTTCTAKESEKFTGVSKVNISFPTKAEKSLPATVERVTLNEAGDMALVVLSCEYVGADVLSLAKATATIEFEAFKGVRINAQALHLQNGEKGVYVKSGNLSRFRKITILYQNEDYILVPLNGKIGTDNEIRLYDEIIVQGSDLQDGKLI